MAQNSRFPSIFAPEVTLIKSFLKVDNRNTVLSRDAVGDFVLKRERISVGDGFFIETSEVYNRSCLAVFPDDKDGPTCRYDSFDGGHPSIFSKFVQDFIDSGFAAFGYTVSTLGLDDCAGLQRNFHPIFFRLNDVSNAIFL
jgi:hypothetical protein